MKQNVDRMNGPKGILRFSLILVTILFAFFEGIFPSGSMPNGSGLGLPVPSVESVWGAPLAEMQAWPHEDSSLKPHPETVWGRLSNGFRYVLLHNSEPMGRVSMHLNVRAGSLHETDGYEGTAHFLEHMVFAGTEHYPSGQLIDFFQSIGMQFGPDVNGHTRFRNTVYDILLPDGEKETVEKGLRVFRDYAGGALLDPKEIERERRVVISEMRTRNRPDFRIFAKTLQFELPDTLMARRLPGGLPESLSVIGPEALKDYYDTWYRPSRMTLVMVGDFDLTLAEQLIRQIFDNLKARAAMRLEPDIGSVMHRGIRPFYHFEETSGATRVTIETIFQVPPEPDSVEFQKKRLLRALAHEALQNRLDGRIRKPGNPFSSAYAGASIFARQLQYAEISAQCRPENWKHTLEGIVEVLEGVLKHGFDPSEAERVKKDYLRDLETAVLKTDTAQSQALSRQIVSSLNSYQVFQSPAQRQALFASYVRGIRHEDLQKVLLGVWAEDHRLVMVTGNARIGGTELPPEKQIRLAYEQCLHQPIPKMCPMEARDFPYLPDPEGKGIVTKKSSIEDLGIALVEFENGVRLNLKKTDYTANEVRVTVGFGRGSSSQPVDKPGLGELTQAVINESGLGGCHKTDLEKALSGKDIDLEFTVLEDRFEFTSRGGSGETVDLVQLLYAYIMDPAYRADACHLCMERFAQEYRSMEKTVEGVWRLHGGRFFGGGDSRLGLPDFQEFSRLTIDDVRQWMDPVFRKAPLEISVVGDFDLARMIDLIGRYFGALPRRDFEAAPPTAPLPIFPAGQISHHTVETGIPKSMVGIAYPTDDFWDIHQTRRLSVLADLFSQRLRVVIREKLGAAYSPYAVSLPSRAYPGYGMIKVVISCHPDEMDRVVTEVRNIASDLARRGVSAEELQRSLEPILTRIKDMSRFNGYWLGSVLTDCVRHPEQLEWARTLAADYAAITRGELHQLARNFLVNERAATLTVCSAGADR